jgi:hypothetical protein
MGSASGIERSGIFTSRYCVSYLGMSAGGTPGADAEEAGAALSLLVVGGFNTWACRTCCREGGEGADEIASRVKRFSWSWMRVMRVALAPVLHQQVRIHYRWFYDMNGIYVGSPRALASFRRSATGRSFHCLVKSTVDTSPRCCRNVRAECRVAAAEARRRDMANCNEMAKVGKECGAFRRDVVDPVTDPCKLGRRPISLHINLAR